MPKLCPNYLELLVILFQALPNSQHITTASVPNRSDVRFRKFHTTAWPKRRQKPSHQLPEELHHQNLKRGNTSLLNWSINIHKLLELWKKPRAEDTIGYANCVSSLSIVVVSVTSYLHLPRLGHGAAIKLLQFGFLPHFLWRGRCRRYAAVAAWIARQSLQVSG
jgi:hypothetical protein